MYNHLGVSHLELFSGILHDDFHTGNVLIIFNIYGADLLAHDFGKAKQLENADYLQDISVITGKLLERQFDTGDFADLLKQRKS